MSQKIQEFIGQLKDKNIHVVGVSGTEAAAIALFLNKKGVKALNLHDFSEEKTIKKHFRNAHSALSIEEQNERLQNILNLPAKFHYKETYLEGIKDADVIFVPQSWYMYECNNPLKKLQSTKQFLHITKLYFHLTDATIIGITGSNGKTTTSNLINHLLKESGRSVYFSGNDRGTVQILEEIEEISKDDLLVLEISNRQLKIDLAASPHIGVITNITPNHLKEYYSFEEYKEGKESLLKYQTTHDYAILNYDDKNSQNIIEKTDNPLGFSTRKELKHGCFVKSGSIYISDEELIEVCTLKDIRLKGEHNLSNICAAFMACYKAGVSTNELKQHVTSFKGLAQRQELVATIDGTEYYNDTTSTSPESLIAAINALEENIILIAGGRNKDLDISELCPKIESEVAELILLDSPFADELKANFSSSYKTHTVKTLKQAVKKAHELSKKGDKVILSPGAEYFVYFKGKMPGYKNFRTFVRRLEEKIISPLPKPSL